jgi:C1A family cysteine protease
VTCFSVYADFFNYHTGIYHHVSGSLQGGHCVCCVGYDDVKRCWICKNSWNTSWGDSGFFNIAYGQVGIDAAMWALEL